MVSDEELADKIREFLQTSDLSVTTNSIVRKKLEEEFKVDLNARKKFIREQVEVFLQDQYEEDVVYCDMEDGEREVVVDQRVTRVDLDDADGDDDDIEDAGDEAEEEDVEDENDNDVVVVEEIRSRGRPRKPTTEEKKRESSLNRLCALSPQLQELVRASELTRTEAFKQVWTYIREKRLQDPNNRHLIICDESLRSLFEANCINIFMMNRALSKHLQPLELDEGNIVKPTPKRKRQKREREQGDSSQKDKALKGPGRSGFIAPYPVSDALKKFTGATELSRAEAVKRIWDYIKENNLQDPSDKKMIICDEKLKELLGVDTFQGFLVSKLLTGHFKRPEQ